jgi:predicted N-formylglutamate amidohydrolase
LQKNIQLLITCEHAGSNIPKFYKKWFKGQEKVLDSHRGYDPGALDMARVIAEKTHSPLVYEKISRLLIEQNRSRKSKGIFSEYCSLMSQQEKQLLFKTVYDPYHENVTACISENIKNSKKTLHFSIHTFTPVMHGQERAADIGLLYDPSRVIELDLCAAIKEKITGEISGLKVRKNFPYKGTSDGLTTLLRRQFAEKNYCGIEIEINQKHFFANSDIWVALKKKLPACLGSIGENVKKIT